MPKTPANGFNGLAFDRQDTLYAVVVQGSTAYKIDKDTGATSVFIAPPEGGADGRIVTLAEGLPGVNAIARSHDVRVRLQPGLHGRRLMGTGPERKAAAP